MVALAALALLVGGAAPAVAHVEVLPDQVEKGTGVEFTIRVPTERALATTRVEVGIPSQVTVYSFAAPPPGWTIQTVRGPDSRFRSVVYTGRSGVNRYVDFHLLGTPFQSGVAVWPTRQTYADGKVKPWTGPPEVEGQETAGESTPTDPGPAASVTIVEAGQALAGPTRAANSTDDSGAGIWLGVIAIGISALSLLALGFLWSTRPARLPGGDDTT